jgi:shikimate kinase
LHTKKNIIALLGFMGTGKSTVGKLLAQNLSWDFLDLDDVLVEKCQMPIADFFATQGEEAFRTLERMALLEVLQSKRNLILSLGGGTPCYLDNMDYIQQYSQSIWITSTALDMLERLKKQPQKRPLLHNIPSEQWLDFIEKKMLDRQKHYQKADFCVQNNASKQDLVTEILEKLKI